nr:hypothetical protein BaRGS_033420 [Batillaria attramentaria]
MFGALKNGRLDSTGAIFPTINFSLGMKTMQQKIQTFFNTCLRRIFNIRWPEKIRNEELWERAGQEPVAKQILRRKWGWIGHTIRKPASSTTRRGKGREAGLAAAGGGTMRQSYISWGPTGLEWQE